MQRCSEDWGERKAKVIVYRRYYQRALHIHFITEYFGMNLHCIYANNLLAGQGVLNTSSTRGVEICVPGDKDTEEINKCIYLFLILLTSVEYKISKKWS